MFIDVDLYAANKWKRFANYLIDITIFYIFILISSSLVFIILYFIGNLTGNFELFYSLEETLNNVNPLLDRIISILLYGLFMFFVEYLSKGRSIGKLITGTMVITYDAEKPDRNTYLKRNFSRCVPFDQLSFFGAYGWHDKWSRTTVVNKKEFESAYNNNMSIESLGENIEND